MNTRHEYNPIIGGHSRFLFSGILSLSCTPHATTRMTEALRTIRENKVFALFAAFAFPWDGEASEHVRDLLFVVPAVHRFGSTRTARGAVAVRPFAVSFTV